MAAVNVIGRRKESVARVRLSEGTGQIIVNDKPISEYFPGLVSQKIYQHPLALTKSAENYLISVKVSGGGSSSQLGALVHGISRALAKEKEEHRKVLKKAGLLTRDPRAKERRKYGNAQKARAKKQSPKR